MKVVQLIGGYRRLLLGGLCLLLIFTALNLWMMSSKHKSNLLNEEVVKFEQVRSTLAQATLIAKSQVDIVHRTIEQSYEYPELYDGVNILQSLTNLSSNVHEDAPLENLPDLLEEITLDIYSIPDKGYSAQAAFAFLQSIPSIALFHTIYSDFAWSYYYDVEHRSLFVYPQFPRSDLFDVTGKDNMEEALAYIYSAGGTYPLELSGPEQNPEKHTIWTVPYVDCCGEGLMVSVLKPVYHESKHVGTMGVDLTLKQINTLIHENSGLKGRLLVLNEFNSILADSLSTEAVLESVLDVSDTLAGYDSVSNQLDFTGLLAHKQGYWMVETIPHTPWTLLYHLEEQAINQARADTLLPNILLALCFTFILVMVILYQHKHYTMPALNLVKYSESLSTATDVLIPKVHPKWQSWFVSLGNLEKDRRASYDKIKSYTEDLEREVTVRTESLTQTMQNLENTQKQLIQNEKMASLGRLVAGIAHELNTPIGNSLTITSSMNEACQELVQSIEKGKLSKSSLLEYAKSQLEFTQILQKSLGMAADQVTKFKSVAVDQSSSNQRCFNVKKVIDETLFTLRPQLKKTPFQLEVNIPDDIEMNSYPGPLSQIICNCFSNALLHAFEGKEAGVFSIKAARFDERSVKLIISDDGKGMTPAQIDSVFEPYFTTKLGEGGTGLGMNIVYNLATDVLRGAVSVDSQLGKGVTFTLILPLDVNAELLL